MFISEFGVFLLCLRVAAVLPVVVIKGVSKANSITMDRRTDVAGGPDSAVVVAVGTDVVVLFSAVLLCLCLP